MTTTTSTETTERVAHFSICGEGLTKIVRNLYCFDENREGAIAILSNLHGMTEEQMIKVCTGSARLGDMSEDGTMGYVEEPDSKFKHEYHAHMLQKERRARKIREGKEAERLRIEEAAKKNHISPEAQEWVNEQNPYHERNIQEMLSPRGQEMYHAGLAVKTKDGTVFQKDHELVLPAESVILIPSTETVRVGKWDVPKNLIDRYATHVVKRIRASIRTGALRSLDPMMVYNMEIERQELHAAICKAVGFDHDEDEPTEEQKEFDTAIANYLDEHAGKLFNGDE